MRDTDSKQICVVCLKDHLEKRNDHLHYRLEQCLNPSVRCILSSSSRTQRFQVIGFPSGALQEPPS